MHGVRRRVRHVPGATGLHAATREFGTISRQEIESRVLIALRDKLMRRDLLKEFRREYVKELNRLRIDHRAKLSQVRHIGCGGAGDPQADSGNQGRGLPPSSAHVVP